MQLLRSSQNLRRRTIHKESSTKFQPCALEKRQRFELLSALRDLHQDLNTRVESSTGTTRKWTGLPVSQLQRIAQAKRRKRKKNQNAVETCAFWRHTYHGKVVDVNAVDVYSLDEVES
jgi:hypothetical protein